MGPLERRKSASQTMGKFILLTLAAGYWLSSTLASPVPDDGFGDLEAGLSDLNRIWKNWQKFPVFGDAGRVLEDDVAHTLASLPNPSKQLRRAITPPAVPKYPLARLLAPIRTNGKKNSDAVPLPPPLVFLYKQQEKKKKKKKEEPEKEPEAFFFGSDESEEEQDGKRGRSSRQRGLFDGKIPSKFFTAGGLQGIGSRTVVWAPRFGPSFDIRKQKIVVESDGGGAQEGGGKEIYNSKKLTAGSGGDEDDNDNDAAEDAKEAAEDAAEAAMEKAEAEAAAAMENGTNSASATNNNGTGVTEAAAVSNRTKRDIDQWETYRLKNNAGVLLVRRAERSSNSKADDDDDDDDDHVKRRVLAKFSLGGSQSRRSKSKPFFVSRRGSTARKTSRVKNIPLRIFHTSREDDDDDDDDRKKRRSSEDAGKPEKAGEDVTEGDDEDESKEDEDKSADSKPQDQTDSSNKQSSSSSTEEEDGSSDDQADTNKSSEDDTEGGSQASDEENDAGGIQIVIVEGKPEESQESESNDQETKEDTSNGENSSASIDNDNNGEQELNKNSNEEAPSHQDGQVNPDQNEKRSDEDKDSSGNEKNDPGSSNAPDQQDTNNGDRVSDNQGDISRQETQSNDDAAPTDSSETPANSTDERPAVDPKLVDAKNDDEDNKDKQASSVRRRRDVQHDSLLSDAEDLETQASSQTKISHITSPAVIAAVNKLPRIGTLPNGNPFGTLNTPKGKKILYFFDRQGKLFVLDMDNDDNDNDNDNDNNGPEKDSEKQDVSSNENENDAGSAGIASNDNAFPSKQQSAENGGSSPDQPDDDDENNGNSQVENSNRQQNAQGLLQQSFDSDTDNDNSSPNIEESNRQSSETQGKDPNSSQLLEADKDDQDRDNDNNDNRGDSEEPTRTASIPTNRQLPELLPQNGDISSEDRNVHGNFEADRKINGQDGDDDERDQGHTNRRRPQGFNFNVGGVPQQGPVSPNQAPFQMFFRMGGAPSRDDGDDNRPLSHFQVGDFLSFNHFGQRPHQQQAPPPRNREGSPPQGHFQGRIPQQQPTSFRNEDDGRVAFDSPDSRERNQAATIPLDIIPVPIFEPDQDNNDNDRDNEDIVRADDRALAGNQQRGDVRIDKKNSEENDD